MTDAEYMKAAMKELGDKFTCELGMQWCEARKKLDALGGDEPETPHEEEAAPEEPAAPPLSADEPEAVVVASTEEPAPAVDAAMEMPEEEHAAMKEIVSSLVEISGGKSLPEIVAAIHEHHEHLVQLLGGTPTDGTPTDRGAVSPADVQNSAADQAVGLLTKQVERLAARLEAQEAKERKAADDAEEARKLSAQKEIEGDVDRFVAAGLIDAGDRGRYVKLASSDPDQYRVLAAPLLRLVGSRTPPTGALYQGGGNLETRLSDVDPDEERYLRDTLEKSGIKDIDGAVKRHFASKSNGYRG